MQRAKWSLATVESGLGGELVQRLTATQEKPDLGISGIFRGGQVLIERPTPEELLSFTTSYRQDMWKLPRRCNLPGRRKTSICIITPEGLQVTRPMAARREYAHFGL
jgi:hypothetical protein